MAVSNIIAFGSTAATSNPIGVDVNGVATVTGWSNVDGKPLHWVCKIDVKMSNNEWTTIGELSYRNPRETIFGEGTYRVRRTEGACLVDLALGA